jgi:predicted ATPase
MGETEPDNGRSPAAPAALPVPFLKRVKIRNYKSIAHCDVELGAFTVLVGRNGSGKSNFLDALRFVADALRLGSSLDHAIRQRGGFEEICSRRCGHPRFIELNLEFATSHFCAAYGFRLGQEDNNDFSVEWEHIELTRGNQELLRLDRNHENITVSAGSEPKGYSFVAHENNLALSLPMFFLPPNRYVKQFVQEMRIYSLHPQLMRDSRSPGSGEVLDHYGSNIAGVFGRIERERPEVKNRILGYLSAIVPGISDIKRIAVGPYETLEFTQTRAGSPPSIFYPLNMSDGTLRAFGALVAVAQLADRDNPVSLVGIEEPEAALHPAASGALMDALHEAAVHTQIVVTTHSPDLLDQLDLESDRLLVVQMRDGVTEIGAVDPASREAIKVHLYTPGELLRMDQLQPDPTDLERQRQAIVTGDAETPE